MQTRTPIQFNVKWCFVAVTTAAIAVAVNEWMLGVLWRMLAPNSMCGYLGVLVFLTAYWFVATGREFETAWNVGLIAWSLALMDSTIGMIASFQVIGTRSISRDMMISLLDAATTGFVIPGLLSIPIVMVLLRRCHGQFSKPTCWFTAAMMFAGLDVILVAGLIVAISGLRVVFGGVLYWTFGP